MELTPSKQLSKLISKIQITSPPRFEVSLNVQFCYNKILNNSNKNAWGNGERYQYHKLLQCIKPSIFQQKYMREKETEKCDL